MSKHEWRILNLRISGFVLPSDFEYSIFEFDPLI